MTERSYRLILGLALLGLLYLDQAAGVYVLIALLAFEAVTNWRIPRLVSRFRYGGAGNGRRAEGARHGCRFDFEAERALRLLFSVVLVVTYVLFNEQLWLFPWFAGFALAIAGLSGTCPILLFLERLGFRPSDAGRAAGAQAR